MKIIVMLMLNILFGHSDEACLRENIASMNQKDLKVISEHLHKVDIAKEFSKKSKTGL